MTEDALVRAIEAKASADAAHHRLDRMNGSIDRLGDRMGEMNGKLDTLAVALTTDQAKREGAETQRKLLLDSRRFVISTVVAGGLVIATLAGALAYVLVTG